MPHSVRRERFPPLHALAEDRSDHAIASHLVIADSTVEKHIVNIFTKLHIPPSLYDHRRVLAVLTHLQQPRYTQGVWASHRAESWRPAPKWDSSQPLPQESPLRAATPDRHVFEQVLKALVPLWSPVRNLRVP
jgi:Bacterial regulatory proteins, luxR family